MKKTSKKKVASKPRMVCCSNCAYQRPHFDMALINCHRYPQTSRANPEHWCGEYKAK